MLRGYGEEWWPAYGMCPDEPGDGCVGHWGGPARDLLPNTSVPFS